jgi:hypothetical protein
MLPLAPQVPSPEEFFIELSIVTIYINVSEQNFIINTKGSSPD